MQALPTFVKLKSHVHHPTKMAGFCSKSFAACLLTVGTESSKCGKGL